MTTEASASGEPLSMRERVALLLCSSSLRDALSQWSLCTATSPRTVHCLINYPVNILERGPVTRAKDQRHISSVVEHTNLEHDLEKAPFSEIGRRTHAPRDFSASCGGEKD
jgi:hypothetical protein